MKRKIKDIILKILEKRGYKLVGLNQPTNSRAFDQKEVQESFEIVKNNTMVPYEGLISLWDQVRYCEIIGMNGALVECGTWKGGAVGLMALANLHYGESRRHIHLFDAFTDICEPDESIDGSTAIEQARKWSKTGGTSGRLKPLEGFYDQFGGYGTLESNKDLLENKIRYDPGFLHYHVGWFQEVLPTAVNEIDKIAILRLDGDWYASTKVCLDYLYKKVVKGGFIIIDDYGAYEGCKKAVDEFIDQLPIKPYLHPVNNFIRYWIKNEE